MQYNKVTGKEYQGSNQVTLQSIKKQEGYSSDAWLTFLQAKQLGLYIKQGSKGVAIFRLAVKQEGEETKTFPVKNAIVFNLDQTYVLEKVGV